MKVIAVNGSPHKNGNTYLMLKTVLDVCRKAGAQAEIFQAGGRTVRGCAACGGCGKTIGRCASDDWVNELYPKMKEADVILLGSPTYFADVTAETKAVMDRCGFISRRDGMAFSRKIGAAVSPARRGGSLTTLDAMQRFFLINGMIIPGSTYWNMSLSLEQGAFPKDEEGVETIENLGENIVWLFNKLNG